MTDQNVSTGDDKKTVSIIDYENKIQQLTRQSLLSSGDEKLIDIVKIRRKELFGQGVSGKEFGQYTAHELSNLRGLFASFAGTLSELEGRLLMELKKQELRNDSKKAQLEKEAYNILSKQLNKNPTIKMVEGYVEEKMRPYKYTYLFKEHAYLEVRNLRYSLGRDDMAIDSRIKVLISERAISGNYLDSTVELPDENSVDVNLEFTPRESN